MSRVRDKIASDILEQFHVPIDLNVVEKLRDWQGRQKLQYESMKGLVHKDFFSVSDWKQQIALYSKTHWILARAQLVILPFVLLNRLLLGTLLRDKIMGLVGKYVRSLHNFDRLFTLPQQLLSSLDSLKKRVTSI